MTLETGAGLSSQTGSTWIHCFFLFACQHTTENGFRVLKCPLSLTLVLLFCPSPPVWHALTPLYLCLLCFFCVTLCSFSPFLSKAQLFLFIPALWSFSLSSLHQLSTLSFFTLLWSLQPLHFHPYTPTVPSIPMLPCLHPPEAEFSINSIAVYKERKGDGEIKRIKGNNRKRGRKRKLAPHDSNSEGKTMMPVAGKAAIHSLHTTDLTITKSWASHTLNP